MDERQPAGVFGAVIPIWATVALAALVAAAGVGAGWLIRGGGDSEAGATASAPAVTVTASPAPDWREAEYAKSARLAGGVTLAHFEEVLGVPMFTQKSFDGALTQHLFQGRDYWVQALVDGDGTVQLMTVTSCDDQFRPRFHGVEGANPRVGQVVLQETPLDGVANVSPTSMDYHTSIATANSYYLDTYYLGNPGNYLTYYAMFNDACATSRPDPSGVFAHIGEDLPPLDPDDPDVKAFRTATKVNTFGWAGPFFNGDLHRFQVGADRIVTRTAPPFPEE